MLLIFFPEDVNGKDEIGIILIAFGVLLWSDVASIRPTVQLKRHVAYRLARFPTFRLGRFIEDMEKNP